MTLEELYTELAAVCQTAYRAFSEAVEPPFIVYYCSNSLDLEADDSNFGPIQGIEVELYTDSKDLATEAELEDALASLELVWTKTELYIDSERLHEVVYSTSSVVTVADESA